MEDLAKGPLYFFWPRTQASTTPHFSQLAVAEMARAFSHLDLVLSFLLPPVGADPHSRSKWELCMPYVVSQYSHFYQAAVDWWEKEALSPQPSSFSLSPSPNFSCQISESGMFTQVGYFASAPAFSKFTMPSRIKALSSDSVKSHYSVHKKVADLVLAQTLRFLHDSVAGFKDEPPQHDLQGV